MPNYAYRRHIVPACNDITPLRGLHLNALTGVGTGGIAGKNSTPRPYLISRHASEPH
jgi:hypothetical protein